MKVFILLLVAAVTLAKPAPLYKAKESIHGRYIVKLKAGHSVDATLSTLGAQKIFHRYQSVFPGFAAELTDRMVKILQESEAVEYIEEDGVARANSVASWGLDRIDQLGLPLDDVYQPTGNQGSGVNVFVLDTGINLSHEDLGGRASFFYDSLGGDGIDCNGHGTHCSGTIGGTAYGVAKAVNLFALRVLNCGGSGSWSGIIAACQEIIDARDKTSPSVASMSLGGGANQAVDDAIVAMINDGVNVAVAAGNDDNNACLYSPARTAEAITVGATDSTDTRAYFSNYGTCVDIFAPGVSITSAWYDSNTATSTISGTSMACPHVAGAAAILVGDDPSLTPAQVKENLQVKSIAEAVIDPQAGSPNLLLYMGVGTGGGYVPEPYDDGCGGTFTDASGEFRSQHYPSNYDNSITCDYLFDSDGSGKQMTVTFTDFELESSSTCSWDDVSIYDGADASATLIGQYCGTNNPGTVTSTGTSLFIRLSTDSSVTRGGFTATYAQV